MEGIKEIRNESVKDVHITFRDTTGILREMWVDWFFEWENTSQIKFRTKNNIFYYPIDKVVIKERIGGVEE